MYKHVFGTICLGFTADSNCGYGSKIIANFPMKMAPSKPTRINKLKKNIFDLL